MVAEVTASVEVTIFVTLTADYLPGPAKRDKYQEKKNDSHDADGLAYRTDVTDIVHWGLVPQSAQHDEKSPDEPIHIDKYYLASINRRNVIKATPWALRPRRA